MKRYRTCKDAPYPYTCTSRHILVKLTRSWFRLDYNVGSEMRAALCHPLPLLHHRYTCRATAVVRAAGSEGPERDWTVAGSLSVFPSNRLRCAFFLSSACLCVRVPLCHCAGRPLFMQPKGSTSGQCLACAWMCIVCARSARALIVLGGLCYTCMDAIATSFIHVHASAAPLKTKPHHVE